MFEFAIGFFAGIMVFYIFLKMMLHVAIKQFQEQVLNEVNTHQISTSAADIAVRIEEYDGVFYVYDIADNTFLGQGSTFTEIKQVLEEKNPNSNVFIAEGDESVIDKIKISKQSTVLDR
jgi:lipopolysaccharide export LptBFGC system permease protein LptF